MSSNTINTIALTSGLDLFNSKEHLKLRKVHIYSAALANFIGERCQIDALKLNKCRGNCVSVNFHSYLNNQAK